MRRTHRPRPRSAAAARAACSSSYQMPDSTSFKSTGVMLSMKKPRPFLIDPRTSWRLGVWDSTGGIILIYTAIVCPYEVAFLKSGDTWIAPRFILNRAIDLFFLIDMLLQLMVMYPMEKAVAIKFNREYADKTMESLPTRRSNVEMITSHTMIARHYAYVCAPNRSHPPTCTSETSAATAFDCPFCDDSSSHQLYVVSRRLGLGSHGRRRHLDGHANGPG